MKRKTTIYNRMKNWLKFILLFPGALLALIAYTVALGFNVFIMKKQVEPTAKNLSNSISVGIPEIAWCFWLACVFLWCWIFTK